MIEALLKLQTLNVEIDHIKAQAQVFPDRLNEVQKNYDLRKKKYEDIKNRLTATKAELADFQNTLALEDQRLMKSRKKLNELHKSYEFQAMKKEIESTERSNAELSTKIAEKSLEIEKNQGEFSVVEEAFKQAETLFNSVKSETEVKSTEIHGVLSQMLAQVKELEASCDKQMLAKYNLIRNRKYLDAIVAVIGGACQGCFMNIPPQMTILMQRNKHVIDTCPNCQRLIFWHEEK